MKLIITAILLLSSSFAMASTRYYLSFICWDAGEKTHLVYGNRDRMQDFWKKYGPSDSVVTLTGKFAKDKVVVVSNGKVSPVLYKRTELRGGIFSNNGQGVYQTLNEQLQFVLKNRAYGGLERRNSDYDAQLSSGSQIAGCDATELAFQQVDSNFPIFVDVEEAE